MKAEAFGPYVLVDLLAETSLGPVYKALPMDGDPRLVYVHSVHEELVQNPAASTLLLTHAQRWRDLRDLHVLNLQEFGPAGPGLAYAFEYQQGRLLSDVLRRCTSEGIPLAHDQAVYLANRIAGTLVSLSTAGLFAGFLSPDQALVTFEGEVKLLPCILRDLQTTPLRQSDALLPYLRYLTPAGREGKPSKASSDRYAVGLLLFEFLCREPFYTGGPDFSPESRLDEAERGIGMLDGLPPSLMRILRRSLLPGSAEAYADQDALKADLDALITSGEYSPTTFNIAFLMHSLFRGEEEPEAQKDQQWLSLDREAFRPKAPEPEPTPPPPPPPKAATRPAPPAPEPTTFSEDFGVEPEPSRKGLYIGIGAAALVVVGIVAGVFLFRGGPSEAEIKAQVEQQLAAERAKFQEQQDAIAKQLAQAQADKQALEQQLSGAKTPAEKEKAKKALEAAQAKIEEQKKQAATLAAQAKEADKAPVVQPPTAPAKAEPSAAPPPKAPEPAPSQSTAQPLPAPATTTPEPPKGAEAARVQRGDFVESWALDAKPKPDKEIKADYTAMARQNRVQGRVTLEISIDESGRPTSASVLRGLTPDYGIHDALIKAAMGTRFSPGMKDGVPVKTKYVVNLNYAMK